jgi:UDP-2,3-diacylglucosamine pyrophosphatase LpxH
MSTGSKKTRRVFISDLHMGDERSLTCHPPQYPNVYGWLRDDGNDGKANRITMLANFLDYLIAHAGDYDELIILGDLLDQWVCPVAFDPTTYDAIVNKTSQNERVIANLRTIASAGVDIDLYYVPGNHDMLLSRPFMEANFPGIRFVGQDNVGVYEADGLAAEHGSQYTLFCGPNPGMGGRLPMGFYISRAAADKNAAKGGHIDIIDALLAFIFDFFKDISQFYLTGMKELYEAIAQGMELELDTPIAMNGLDCVHDSPLVVEVADAYADLWRRWERRRPNGVSALQGMMNELFHLHGVANRHYFETDKAKIVVFGHTHKYTMQGYNRQDDRLNDSLLDPECDYIYANSGTWINDHDYCTYVETELDPDEGKHYVRLYRYESPQDPAYPMGERYIKLK